jgi:hypothetical protein
MAGLAEVEPEPWPTDAAGRYLPVKLHAPESERLDHDPTASEILATLRAGLGDLEAVAVRPNEQVDRMTPGELADWHRALSQPAPPAPTYRTARGRVIDLASCSTDDLHRALDQLERSTCVNGGCRRGQPCARHTRRKRGHR